MKSLRVLALAESANPQWTSVPLVGWSHSRALAEVVDLHLVTQIRNRKAILETGLQPGRDFTTIDSEKVARPIWAVSAFLGLRRGRSWTTATALGSLSNLWFENLVWKQFRSRLERREFDLVHRLTPVSPAVPSVFAERCRRLGIPFILGPINGGVPWPKGFGDVRRREGEWLSYARGVHKVLPGYRSTLRASSAILVASRYTWAQVSPSCRRKTVYIPENAIHPDRFPDPPRREPSSKLRVAFLGRMVPCKGIDMLLEAAAPLIREGRMILTLIGDGPERAGLEQMTRAREIGDGVRFTGWVAQPEVHKYLFEVDAMAFPSVHDFGGGAVVEAMACGAVPVVLNYGGPAELLNSRSGWLVEMGTRSQVIERLRAALKEIAENPGQVEARRQAGMERVRTLFTWQAKARQVLEVYRWVLGERDDKPDFGMPFRDPDAPGERSDSSLQEVVNGA